MYRPSRPKTRTTSTSTAYPVQGPTPNTHPQYQAQDSGSIPSTTPSTSQYPMVTPSIEAPMPNAIPSTNITPVPVHEALVSQLLAHQKSLGFPHRLSQLLWIPGEGKGINKIHTAGKGAGGGHKRPNRPVLGWTEASSRTWHR